MAAADDQMAADYFTMMANQVLQALSEASDLAGAAFSGEQIAEAARTLAASGRYGPSGLLRRLATAPDSPAAATIMQLAGRLADRTSATTQLYKAIQTQHATDSCAPVPYTLTPLGELAAAVAVGGPGGDPRCCGSRRPAQLDHDGEDC